MGSIFQIQKLILVHVSKNQEPCSQWWFVFLSGKLGKQRSPATMPVDEIRFAAQHEGTEIRPKKGKMIKMQLVTNNKKRQKVDFYNLSFIVKKHKEMIRLDFQLWKPWKTICTAPLKKLYIMRLACFNIFCSSLSARKLDKVEFHTTEGLFTFLDCLNWNKTCNLV